MFLTPNEMIKNRTPLSDIFTALSDDDVIALWDYVKENLPSISKMDKEELQYWDGTEKAIYANAMEALDRKYEEQRRIEEEEEDKREKALEMLEPAFQQIITAFIALVDENKKLKQRIGE